MPAQKHSTIKLKTLIFPGFKADILPGILKSPSACSISATKNRATLHG